MPMLDVDGLTVRFGGLTALSDVALQVEEGQIHGLIGPNGAGKSTLFNVLSRFVEPAAGSVTFAGRDLLRLAPHEIIGAGIARTFQNLLLCQRLTVLENVLIGLHHRLRVPFWGAVFNLPGVRREEQEARAQALVALEQVGLHEAAGRRVSELPYGAQKRVEVARALVSRPRLLLLDEPAAGLTESERREFSRLIRRLREELGTTIVLVEHDLGLVLDLCDIVTVLDFGRVIARGTPQEVRSDPDVIAAYIGADAGDGGQYGGTAAAPGGL